AKRSENTTRFGEALRAKVSGRKFTETRQFCPAISMAHIELRAPISTQSEADPSKKLSDICSSGEQGGGSVTIPPPLPCSPLPSWFVTRARGVPTPLFAKETRRRKRF